MNVKEAVQVAKAYIADIFAEEKIGNIGLEEVEFLHGPNVWRVTIGFSRGWNEQEGLIAAIARSTRLYKVISINDEDGRVLSMKNRIEQVA